MSSTTHVILLITITLVLTVPTITLTAAQDDLDPLVDLQLTFNVLYLRDLENNQILNFHLNLWINNHSHQSPTMYSPREYNPWTVTQDIPDTDENVTIRLELWDNILRCDLSPAPNQNDTGYAVTLTYNVKTGHWTGDDYLGDPSGYGRLNGCDDGSIYTTEHDCELGFTIYTNDYDNDTIPYWTETHEYGTDPTVDDRGTDADHDGIPIEWEHHWGYDPLHPDNHSALDPDDDSITNHEEYLTSLFNSDPFRRDLFLEMDFMEPGPNGEQSIVPNSSIEQLKDPFHRRNIMVHVDTGELDGGELIPFDPLVTSDELIPLYNQYFLHNDPTTWRRSVFHYGLYVYSTKPNGYGFSGDVEPHMGYLPGTNSFIISSKQMEKNARLTRKPLDFFYAAATMHETGHTLGIRNGHPPGCDVFFSKHPWQPGWWIYRTYQSIMNYHYTYRILDYSDGSHGKRDYDDWSNLDFTHFEIPST